MSRFLVAGLFIISLAFFTGCPESQQAKKPDQPNTKRPTGITGMNSATNPGSKLDPPPKLTIPESAKKYER
ncbi:MAG: hypothetical protein AB8B55_22070 [Mariniblastus sp.]